MPKVSHFNIEIDGDYRRIDVFYNKKEKFHIGNVLTDVLKLGAETGDYAVTISGFDTEAHLKTSIYECAERYHEKKSSSRKVIAYSLYATSEIGMNEATSHFGGKSFSGKRKGISKNVRSLSGCDFGIGFSFEVLLEINKNGKTYHRINEDGTVGYERDITRNEATVIDWSAERVAAFEMLGDGMYKLMCKISTALGTEEAALKFLESKIKLLT